MSTIIYPGTFDPPHLGHLNIIERLAQLFDQLTVAIGYDDQKPAPFFPLQTRCELINQLICSYPNVTTLTFSSLLIDQAKALGCSYIARSICALADYEREQRLAFANKAMSGIETLFLFPDPPFHLIRSSVIRDIGIRGGCLAKFVPKKIEKTISQAFLKKNR